ncbi:MAG TPA: alpha-amylase family protein [archaeon]|nr:alpha-amylase family protein [archaeon]
MKQTKIPIYKFILALTAGFLLYPVVSQAASPENRPQWWLEHGICLAGNWEPLVFRVRRGPIPTNYRARYEYEHSPEAVLGLKACGVNMIITHFYKGLGLENEAEDLAWTKKLAGMLHKNGMFVGAYIGSTLFNENLYREIPQSESWKQTDLSGETIKYSASQYFRDRADFTLQGYREHIKAIVTRAIKEYGMDLIHFDNFNSMFSSQAGLTENIRQLFRQYLDDKYTPEERKELLGFSDVSLVSPPRLAGSPMSPVTDPLAQEWTYFRVEAMTGYVRELSEHIHALNPQVVMETNPLGLSGRNRPYEGGMDHAHILPYTDIFWSEDPDHACYYPESNRLVSKIRSYKLARHFGNALFSYSNNPLEIAEAMAFNRMCLGDVGYRNLENWPESLDLDDDYRYSSSVETLDSAIKAANRKYMQFFHEHKELFRGLEVLADVGVMRDFESLTFGGWVPYLATIQAEQVLIQNRVPFTLLFHQDWEHLEDYRIVVLAAQENLSDKEIGRLKDYMERGGSLAVAGSTGAYDERRRMRGPADNFWRLLGAEAPLREPGKAARISLGKGRIFYFPGFESHPRVPEFANEVHPDYWYLPLNWEEFMEGLFFLRGGEFTVTVETRPHVAAAHYRKGAERQVHLVNYWPGHPAKYIPVIFSEKGLKPKKATLYSPDHDRLSLDLAHYRDGWMALVPEVKTYGIVVLE